MKRFCLLVVSLLFSVVVYAQQVTTFLGIPVDGSKSKMIQKLKAKGFRSTIDNQDVLEGEFNGHEVHIHVVTNKNKVYRIMVSDVNTIDEVSIRIRFNRLLKQFKDNDKYVSPLSLLGNTPIPDDEDISKNKRYEAVFYQRTPLIDSSLNEFARLLASMYTDDQINNMTLEMASDIAKYYDALCGPYLKTSVWFMICEFNGEYFISMYYDNKYNEANGEDL